MADDKAAAKRRRFYKDARHAPAGEGGFHVLLDGRPVRTPGRAELAIAKEPLAEAVAAEWAAQGEHIEPMSMPLTQIACTAIDRVAANRDETRGLVAKYAETDLICYRAASPQDLVERQTTTWQPVLDWLASEKGIALEATTSILPIQQDAGALDAVRAELDPLDDHELAALAVMTQAMGSVALALALAHGRLAVPEAVAASQLDEGYQSELWGTDQEAEQRLKGLQTDIDAAARYLALHRG